MVYPSNSALSAGPSYTVQTFNGVATEGYFVRYQFNIRDLTPGGGSDIQWPATFVDSMPEFPGARIFGCRSTVSGTDSAGTSPWTLTCPLNEVQRGGGWNLSIRPNSGDGSDTGVGHVVMTVFVPLADMNRAIDPNWVAGAPPVGQFSFDNAARRHRPLGAARRRAELRQCEPGTDGTGNNLATRTVEAEPPRWDLIKRFQGGPSFSTQTINGAPVDGYVVDYLFTILDLEGPGNVAPWLDRPVTFTDRLVSHPDAFLLHCRQHTTGSPALVNGTATCETGAQPADGWDMSFVPDQTGFDRRRGDFIARVFIPLDQIQGNLCSPNVFLDLRNEAINSDGLDRGWRAEQWHRFRARLGWRDGHRQQPARSPGSALEPRATAARSPATRTSPGTGRTSTTARRSPEDTVNSWVTLSANNGRVSVADMKLCDVFDVSVFRLDEATIPRIGGTGITESDYVIEYAIGPNNVDTQAGPLGTDGNFPIERTDLVAAPRRLPHACRARGRQTRRRTSARTGVTG